MNIRIKPLALLIGSALSLSASAAGNGDPATIIVTATRQPMHVTEALADVTVIDRETIEQSGETSLTDLLARQPGLQITANGGPGASTNIFLRGAEARHTLVLVDGMRIRSATTGQAGFESIPLGEIDRIEILRGPASALYGSDAIGGVIQIFTRHGEGAIKPNLYLGFGSYNTSQVGAGVGGTQGNLSFNLHAGWYDSDGFNATTRKLSSYNADNDGFRQQHASGNLAYRFNEGDELGGSFLYADGTNHYDAGTSSFDARLEKSLASAEVHLLKRVLPNWTSQLRVGGSFDENFSLTATSKSLYRTDQNQYQWQNDIRLPLGRALVALERSEDRVSGTTHYTVSRRTVDSAVLGWSARLGSHDLQANLRHDDNSQFGSKMTWQAAYGYRFGGGWRAHAGGGTAFNAPTFNQLYWPNTGYGGGNPNLKPELARNAEVGLAYTQDNYSISLTAYRNRVQDLISGWPPVNVNRARIEGATLAYTGTWAGWHFTASLDALSALDETTGKRLPRRANHQVHASAVREFAAWTVGAELTDVGRRYDEVTNSAAKLMHAYSIANLFARYRVDPAWSVEARANNIGNVKYETAWGYATPGANLFVGVRYAPR